MPQNQINLLNPRCKNNPFSFRARIFAFTSSVIAATMFIVWAVSAANTTIGNNITTSGNLTVSGASSLASLILSSSFNASSTLQVSATSTFYSFVGLGTTTPSKLLSVQGDMLLSGNISSVANITATGTLNVAGHSTLATASTTMITASDGFISSASSTITNLSIINATSTNATTTSLAVTGNASTSQLVVSNSATLNTLTGNGLFTLNSGLLSTASSTFSSNLSVSGPLSASSTLLVANLSTLTGGFVSQASSTISSNLLVSGALNASSSLAVAGTVTLSNATPLAFTNSSTSTIPSGTINAWSIATSTTANPILSISSTGVTQGNGGRGRVGIGTANPAAQLEVMDIATSTKILVTAYSSSYSPAFFGQLARGTPDSPSAVQLNDTLANFGGLGFDGNGFTLLSKGMFRVRAAENWTNSANGAFLAFETTLIGGISRSEKMRLSDAGSLGIGTTTPGALLAVQGNALISGNLNVANITATGTLNVAGHSTLATASTTMITASNGFISSASSTIMGDLSITGALRGSSTATSTMQNGINLVTGCFSINGVCVGGGGSSNWTDAGAYLTPATLSDGIIISASSTVSGNFIVTGGLNASSTLTVAGNSIFYSNVGIATTSPGALLSVQGNALFSGNLNVANIAATGTISVTGTSGTSTIGSLTISPSGKIGIGTTTPNLANFEVATRTIAFNSGADADLGIWATSSNTFSASREHSSVAANGYVYVMGGDNPEGTSKNTVQYAKLNSDGSVGSWATSTNTFAARGYHSSVTANGYVYVLGGWNNTGVVTNTVQYAKLNSDGSVGSWTTSANTFAARYRHSSVVANGFVYVLGGVDGSETDSTTNTVQYAKLNSDGTVGSWATSTNSFAARNNHSSVIANGYVYVIGGANPILTSKNTVQYAKLNSDGTVGSWATSTNNLLITRADHSSVTANGYVYVLGNVISGASAGANTVEYAKLNSDGSVGPWTTSANTFAARGWHSSVTANGYVYVLGGQNTSNIIVGAVNYASTARILVSGNLDLLGLASTTLGDVNSSDFGSVGGSIFAGNIFSAGQLQVTGNALFSNGVGINGTLSVNATTSGVQDVPIFSIQNATATNPLLTVLYNGNVGIGTSSPSSALSINGTCIDTGAGCADYAELYTSSEPVGPGDVLAFDQEHAGQVRKAKAGDTALIGAVSSNPAIIIEGSALQLMSGVNYKSNPTKPAVALAGKIPVKVNLEGGDINIGDPITISSIPGVGKKAVQSGKIIGYALEPLSQATTSQAVTAPKILMFVSLGYWLDPDMLALSSSNGLNATSTNSSLALSQSNGLLAQVVDTIKAWLESMKVFISDGLVRLKNLVAEKITAQKAVLDEIELKDEDTGDIYCVRIKTGALLTTPGECGSNAVNIVDSAAAVSDSAAVSDTATTTTTNP